MNKSKRATHGAAQSFPAAPAAWSTDTSAEQWIPDLALRTEIARQARLTIKQKPMDAKKSWAKLEKLLPAPLTKVIPGRPWRWGNVVSPAVAEVAMALLAYAVEDAASGERVMSELNRILPDGPSFCLPEVVGQKAYARAVEAIESQVSPDEPDAEQLEALVDYLTST